MDGREADHPGGEFEAFAAAVAHELRTPLAALSGEVELALRRERTPAAYREALSRISVSIAELVDLTADLTFLGHTSLATDMAGKTARTDALLAHVAERFRARAGDVHVVETTAESQLVAGDAAPLVHAVTLVLEHALRHRREGARVLLRVAEADDAGAAAGFVDLLVDAAAVGFWPKAWLFLAAPNGAAASVSRPAAGPLRLRTAERIIRDCGGSLFATSADGLQTVRIRLRRAETT